MSRRGLVAPATELTEATLTGHTTPGVHFEGPIDGPHTMTTVGELYTGDLPIETIYQLALETLDHAQEYGEFPVGVCTDTGYSVDDGVKTITVTVCGMPREFIGTEAATRIHNTIHRYAGAWNRVVLGFTPGRNFGQVAEQMYRLVVRFTPDAGPTKVAADQIAAHAARWADVLTVTERAALAAAAAALHRIVDET